MVCSTLSNAAEIEILTAGESGVSFVLFEGEVRSGDAVKFYEATRELSKAIVFLDSPGGLLNEAFAIGSHIRRHGLSTSVVGNKKCFSACALIWLAGNNRYMWRNSVIGFHAAYLETYEGAQVSGTGNAEVGSYLTHLGLGREAIRFATTAGPAEFLKLTPEIAQAFGIEIVLSDGDRFIDPNDRPSGEALARQFVLITAWSSRCEGWLAPISSAMIEHRNSTFEIGNELLGGDLWIEFQFRALEEYKDLFEAQGELPTCLMVHDELVESGVSTSVTGPGFACSKASTSTELAICSTPDLWADDHAMNAIYLVIKDTPRSSTRSRYFEEQRAWLKLRDGCGADLTCLRGVYDLRINQLWKQF